MLWLQDRLPKSDSSLASRLPARRRVSASRLLLGGGALRLLVSINECLEEFNVCVDLPHVLACARGEAARRRVPPSVRLEVVADPSPLTAGEYACEQIKSPDVSSIRKIYQFGARPL